MSILSFNNVFLHVFVFNSSIPFCILCEEPEALTDLTGISSALARSNFAWVQFVSIHWFICHKILKIQFAKHSWSIKSQALLKMCPAAWPRAALIVLAWVTLASLMVLAWMALAFMKLIKLLIGKARCATFFFKLVFALEGICSYWKLFWKLPLFSMFCRWTCGAYPSAIFEAQGSSQPLGFAYWIVVVAVVLLGWIFQFSI